MSDHDERSDLDAQRLWAGGAATAVVAGLAAVAGVLIARGVFRVPVLAPESYGLWGDADTGTYALLAAAAALLATGLRHLLSVTTPEPGRFFGWIMATTTVIGIVLPLTLGADLASQLATAVINLGLGAIITLLVQGTAASAQRVRERARYQYRTYGRDGYDGDDS
ncbi:DUF6069 family protein [Kibdelosporangium lantanae]